MGTRLSKVARGFPNNQDKSLALVLNDDVFEGVVLLVSLFEGSPL